MRTECVCVCVCVCVAVVALATILYLATLDVEPCTPVV